MTCDQYRQWISQRIDGDLSIESGQSLDSHLGSCSACTRFHNDAWSLHRALRVTPVAAASSSTAPELTPAALVGSPGLASGLRWVLAVIGATLVILNAQAMFGAGDSLEPHISRHDSIFGVALGIGMLIVAARPHRAIGLVPLTTTIAVLMIISAFVDLASGQATMLGEAIHVVELAGLACLWVISGGVSRLGDRAEAAIHRLRRSTVPTWPTA